MQYGCLLFVSTILFLLHIQEGNSCSGHHHHHHEHEHEHDHGDGLTNVHARKDHGHDHDHQHDHGHNHDRELTDNHGHHKHKHDHHHDNEENSKSSNKMPTNVTETMENMGKTRNADTPTVSLTQKWMHAILAAFVVSSTSLVGLLFLCIKKDILCKLMDHVTSFAVGTLLATVIFHVYPEAQEYLADHNIDWICHGLFIAGIIAALTMEQALHLIVHAFGGVHLHGHGLTSDTICAPLCDTTTSAVSGCILPTTTCDHGHYEHQDVNNHDHHDSLKYPHPSHDFHQHASTGTCIVSVSSTKSNLQKPKFLSREAVKSIKPVALIVALGDFFHSFIDGILIAIAFQLCDQQVGWLVTSAVILHEIPHRVGDFFVFLKSDISPRNAAYLNLAASLSSVLGVVLLLSINKVSNHTLGYMLSFASGMLLFIALSELLPSVMHNLNLKTLFINLFCMIGGVILIKIVLTDHVHCGVSSGHDHHHHHHHHHH